MRRLIVNADDFGYSADTFVATKSLLEARAIKSATIMTGYEWTSAAVAYAKDNSADCSFGLHLNIAEGAPQSDRGCPSLVNEMGVFIDGGQALRLKYLFGRFDPVDVQAEAVHQLTLLADQGVRISHLDSHGHMHKFPPVMRALAPVLEKFDITRVRGTQTLYDNPTWYNRMLDSHCRRGFSRAYQMTDHFFNTRGHGVRWLENVLDSLPAGTTELGLHPGSDPGWRISETAPFASGVAAQALADRGIALVSYWEL
jgi:chitin disaccharide deacetylase